MEVLFSMMAIAAAAADPPFADSIMLGQEDQIDVGATSMRWENS